MNYGQLTARLERYPGSPLFARLASEYLDSGRVSDARTLCEAGLLEYPEYATAHLILAECHAAENRYRDAVDSLLSALALNPDSLLYSGLLEEWEELLAVAPPVAAPTLPESEPPPPEGITVTPEWVQAALESAAVPPGTIAPAPTPEASPARSGEDASEAAGAPPIFAANAPPSVALPPQSVTIPPQSASVFSELLPDQQREGKLLTEAVNPPGEHAGEMSDEGRIVSKTLAEIYVTQGAFDEAILTYRLLRRARPELVPQINRRIVELEGLASGR